MRLKTLLSLTFFLVINTQAQTFDDWLIKGKNTFKNGQYTEAIQALKKAIALNPQNPEAHYFLGYCYSRLNSNDANNIPNSSLELTLLSSKEFETVNQLSPKYTGEYVILDPYSKITAEWGSAGLKYLYHHKKDSAIWALKQGKARGGFGDFFMNYNRMNMENCRKNAFLFLSGDNYTFYCLYLQLVEQFRTDVKAVDPAMLGTLWYPALLRESFHIQFDKTSLEVDSCHYSEWHDSTISIGDFQWVLKPSYENTYLLRKDHLLLSILKANAMNNEINFINGYPTEDKISLDDECNIEYCLERVRTFQVEKNWDSIISGFNRYLYLSDKINPNSRMEVLNFESIQIRTMYYVYLTHFDGDYEHAKKLMTLFNKHRKHYRQAFSDEEVQNYYNSLNELFVKE